MNPDSQPTPPHKETEWYAQGLRFECTRCGNCCSGPPGFVWINQSELEQLADSLNMTTAEFERRYTRRVHGRISLTEVRTGHGLDCVFLDRSGPDGPAACRVYAHRPVQCRTFPFWPENLNHPRDWQRTARTCPGINTGRLVPVEQIRILRDS